MDKFRLTLLSLAHAVVDAVAAMVTPLMLVFQRRFDLADTTASLLLVAMAAGASMAQPVFAYLSDRVVRDGFVFLGPLVATVSVALMAVMPSYTAVSAAAFVAGLGVAAFHPEAAVLAGQYGGRRRTVGLSVLVCGGLVGLSAGPVAVAALVEYKGLEQAHLLALPGLMLAPLLAVHLQREPTGASGGSSVRRPGRFWGRSPRIVGLLLAISVIRAGVVTGYQAGLAFLAKEQALPLTTVGLWTSVYLFSGGLAGLVMSLVVRRGQERWTSVWTFAAAVPASVAFAFCWHVPVLGLAVLALAGATGQANVPQFISMGQRLMPRGAAMASALLMGASWGLGGGCPLVVAGLQEPLGAAWALAGLGGLMVLAAALSLGLPKRRVGFGSLGRGGEPAC